MMFMMVWMLVFWVAVAGGVVWLVAALSRRNSGNDALAVLRERLASGEIGVEEFRSREETLKQSNGGRTLRGLILLGGGIVVAVFIVVPAIVMAGNGWDMWDMHGRGRNTADSPVIRAGEQATVRIQDFSFSPGNLEVPVGARVTWTNEDSAPHDATARSGDWKTERLSNGESDSMTFDAPGEFDYYCSVHPSMKARILVR